MRLWSAGTARGGGTTGMGASVLRCSARLDANLFAWRSCAACGSMHPEKSKPGRRGDDDDDEEKRSSLEDHADGQGEAPYGGGAPARPRSGGVWVYGGAGDTGTVDSDNDDNDGAGETVLAHLDSRNTATSI